jgi:uracil-DNA glycosylase
VEPDGAVQSLLDGLTEPGWKELLSEHVQTESFRNLAVFLEEERAKGRTIFPPRKDLFSALNLCPLDEVKVVIIGQDPYHGPGQAHGLAFSVQKGVRAPPSLQNIIREAIEDVGIEEPHHGNLEHWAKQGVLLLNAVLTVRQGEANSHAKKGWEEFTDAVIEKLTADEKHAGLVFLLWGNAAQKKAEAVVDGSKHTIICTSHPSPLGATKTGSPFLGSKCFSRTNTELINLGKEPIDWNLD